MEEILYTVNDLEGKVDTMRSMHERAKMQTDLVTITLFLVSVMLCSY